MKTPSFQRKPGHPKKDHAHPAISPKSPQHGKEILPPISQVQIWDHERIRTGLVNKQRMARSLERQQRVRIVSYNPHRKTG